MDTPALKKKDTISPKVAVIILNYNGGQVTVDCLASLKSTIYPTFEIILIDNGSVDNSIETIRKVFPETTLYAMGKNFGFAEGNNIGIQKAFAGGADYVLLLNNDTVVHPDFLHHLVDAIQLDDKIGVAGPTIYYYDQPDTIWSAGGMIDWSRGITRMNNIGEVDRGQFGHTPHEVEFITGCAMLVKRECIQKVGLLDARFFAYYEETEWCVRIRRAGFQICHVPDARIWHKITPEAREASPLVHYYMTRNRLLFLKLVHAGIQPWFYTFYNYCRLILSWTLQPRWREKKDQKRAMIRAILDYGRGRFGQYIET